MSVAAWMAASAGLTFLGNQRIADEARRASDLAAAEIRAASRAKEERLLRQEQMALEASAEQEAAMAPARKYFGQIAAGSPGDFSPSQSQYLNELERDEGASFQAKFQGARGAAEYAGKIRRGAEAQMFNMNQVRIDDAAGKFIPYDANRLSQIDSRQNDTTSKLTGLPGTTGAQLAGIYSDTPQGPTAANIEHLNKSAALFAGMDREEARDRKWDKRIEAITAENQKGTTI